MAGRTRCTSLPGVAYRVCPNPTGLTFRHATSSRIRTVSKGFHRPSLAGGNAYMNDARILATDIDVSNGVIHVIDRVLLPG